MNKIFFRAVRGLQISQLLDQEALGVLTMPFSGFHSLFSVYSVWVVIFVAGLHPDVSSRQEMIANIFSIGAPGI